VTSANGAVVPNDRCLVDEKLGPIAHVYRINGGPQNDRWFWAVLIDAQDRPWNSGSGSAPSGAAAKAEVERIVDEFDRSE
jgi:hypothetical protein